MRLKCLYFVHWMVQVLILQIVSAIVCKKKVPNLFLVMIKTVSGPWLLNTCWCVLHFFFPCDVFYFSTEIPCLTLHQVMCKIFLTEL